MGLEAGTLALLLGGGLNAAGQIIGGGGQDLKGFGGLVGPETLLGNAKDANQELGGLVFNQATSPTSLPGSFAQTPPTFTGGGLPMPVGVTGRDPALFDPQAFLTRPGLDGTPAPPLPTGGGFTPSPGPSPTGGGGPRLRGSVGGLTGQSTFAQPQSTQGPQLRGGGGDAQQAIAALNLIMPQGQKKGL